MITTTDIEQLKFPIGKFSKPDSFTKELLALFISDIESFPQKLQQEVAHLNGQQLDTPYRPEGWTIRQVVHHCADSHMNSIIRFKLALTEEQPVIKPYFEDKWAELPDYKLPIEPSLLLLEGLHFRWTILLKSFKEADLEKKFIHPEHSKEFRLNEAIGMYAWHCNHHLAHVTELKKREGWK